MPDSEGNAYGPYDIEVEGSESEAFTEQNWARLSRASGVYSGGELTFTGLTATLSAIDMVSHGFFLDTSARLMPWSYSSPATTGAQPRRDLLVARRQLTAGEGAGATPGKTFLTVIPGTPAATPVDPDHDPDNDELLWSWQVPASGGTVVTAVRDLRRWPDANDTYYAQGSGVSSPVTTTPTEPSGVATLTLPKGPYDFDIRGHFSLSVSDETRQIRLHLYAGSTELFQTSFTVGQVAGTASRAHTDFVRATLSEAATVRLRTSANATGGTQAITANAIRAVRV